MDSTENKRPPFDPEKYFQRGSFVTDHDIKTYGMCVEDPTKECYDSCRKFVTLKCDGAVLIKQAGGTTWSSRAWFKQRRAKRT